MHGSYNFLDLNWYFQFIITVVAVLFGLLFIVKNTASKYFVVDDAGAGEDHRFDSPSQPSPSPSARASASPSTMPGRVAVGDACVVCGNLTKKHCSRCKLVRYCSESCQRSHWFSGHKEKCEDFRLSSKSNLQGRKSPTAVAATSKKILFPYDEFVDLFNWKNPGFRPCGLLNCGNSCFANVVLQCLAYTRPLAAYLLEKGHKRGCRRNDWCFLCELQTHVERACQSIHAFSPINILSRLPNIGGNLGCGKQEDAHELMRFAVDTMQLVCLDEYGGERAVHPTAQETTLIQHIFGGRLQSEVICTKCNNVSKQFENMMDLTVEIQGDAASLEECLDQFTAKERLDGDNMYKCDRCNDYVLAWKRLNIHLPPNILTIALKRFQSGRFGKLNKRVTFPETLDLSPYMSESGDGDDKYMLYAVVVHVDMLNASFFGHYICYTRDFSGNWYRIDDCKVTGVEIDEVLSQGAYMLLYSRVSVRSSCLYPMEDSSRKHETLHVSREKLPSARQTAEYSLAAESVGTSGINRSLLHDSTSHSNVFTSQNLSYIIADVGVADSKEGSSVLGDAGDFGTISAAASKGADGNRNEADGSRNVECVPITDLRNEPVSIQNHVNGNNEIVMGVSASTSSVLKEADGRDSVDSGCKPEKPELTTLPLSDMEHASRKLEKTGSSGARSKPIFAPGFLGRRQGKIINNKQDRKSPALSVEDVSTLSSSNNSLATFCFTEASIPKFTEPPLPVSDVGKGNEMDVDGPAECMLVNGLTNKSVAIQSYVSENGEIDKGVSASTSSIGEEADEIDSMDLEYKLERAELTIPPVGGVEDATRCLEQTSSNGAVIRHLERASSAGARLKPIFSPGFLVKQPLKAVINQESIAPPESVDIKAENGEPVLSYQKIGDKEDEIKPLAFNGSLSPGIRKPAVKSYTEIDMVNGGQL